MKLEQSNATDSVNNLCPCGIVSVPTLRLTPVSMYVDWSDYRSSVTLLSYFLPAGARSKEELRDGVGCHLFHVVHLTRNFFQRDIAEGVPSLMKV
jgi:hypothetical protein